MIAHLFLLPIDGCSINPSRSFGPSLVRIPVSTHNFNYSGQVATWAGIDGSYYKQQHIFWFGPYFGAALAALFYEYLGLKPENFEGAKDMDTAIFQANKRRAAHVDPAPAALDLPHNPHGKDTSIEVHEEPHKMRVTFQDETENVLRSAENAQHVESSPLDGSASVAEESDDAYLI